MSETDCLAYSVNHQVSSLVKKVKRTQAHLLKGLVERSIPPEEARRSEKRKHHDGDPKERAGFGQLGGDNEVGEGAKDVDQEEYGVGEP